MKSKERYFIVGYFNGKGAGTSSVTVTGGGYVNLKQFEHNLNSGPVAIISITEVNKSDFDNFNSEEK
jgi:hypothetical protein